MSNSTGPGFGLAPVTARVDRYAPLVVFAAVGLLAFAYRYTLGDLFGGDRIALFGLEAVPEPIDWWRVLTGPFGPSPGFYRPLSSIIAIVVNHLFAQSVDRYLPLILGLFAVANGALAAAIYMIARELSRSWWAPFFATVLFVGSTTNIVASWYLLYAVLQLPACLTMVAAVLGYLKYRRSRRVAWLLLMVAGAVLAPWFREIGVLAAAVIFGYELVRFPWERSPVLFLAGLLLLHGLFPTALPSLLGLYEGDVQFILHHGPIDAALGSGSLNYDRPGRIFNQIPPILWGVVVVASAFYLADLLRDPPRPLAWLRGVTALGLAPEERNGDRPRRCTWKWIGWGVGGAVLVFGLFAGSMVTPPVAALVTRHPMELTPQAMTLLFLIFGMAVTALRFGVLLPGWFLAALAPLMLIPTNHEIHLVYIAIPLSLIAALWSEDLLLRLGRWYRGGIRTVGFAVSYFALAIAAADQLENIPASYAVQKRLLVEHEKVALWLRDTLPTNSIVMTNFFSAFEIYDRSGRHFAPKWVVASSPINQFPKHPTIHEYTDQIGAIDEALHNGRDVYYLLVTSQNADGWFRLPRARLERVRDFQFHLRYPYIDPLRYFIDTTRYIRFVGYTDWLTTFAYLDTYEATPFLRDWTARLTLFKLDPPSARVAVAAIADRELRLFAPVILPYSTEPSPQVSPTALPSLIVEGAEGTDYNIIKHAAKYYGLAQSDGPFDIMKVESGAYARPVYIGDSLEEVTELILKGLAAQPEPAD